MSRSGHDNCFRLWSEHPAVRFPIVGVMQDLIVFSEIEPYWNSHIREAGSIEKEPEDRSHDKYGAHACVGARSSRLEKLVGLLTATWLRAPKVDAGWIISRVSRNLPAARRLAAGHARIWASGQKGVRRITARISSTERGEIPRSARPCSSGEATVSTCISST